MTRRHLITLSAGAAALLVLLGTAHLSGGGAAVRAGGVTPAAVPAAERSETAAGTPAAGRPEAWLEAARVVRLYCRLVDDGRLRNAAALCSRHRLLPRLTPRTIRRCSFRSARIYAEPDSRTLVVLARVRVLGGRRCPWRDGHDTLFFALGRAGIASGDWLITAVTTRP